MLEKIKVALRIGHKKLDNDIMETIKIAQAEMIRLGISESKAKDEGDSLIFSAIKTYCLSVYINDEKRAQGFFESWKYQLDNIRKSIKPESIKESDPDV